MPTLSRYAFALIAAHIVLIPLAVIAEWPAQFDPSSDPDAGAEWASRGTAISAPLAPLAGLLGGALLARRRDGWGMGGVVLLALAGVVMLIGSLGELFADAEQTPRTVLVIAGIVGAVLSVTLLALAARDLRARRR